MLVPRYVTTAFFSGAKGGTGKSTIASNAAIALSMALRSYVTLIDLGIDSTQTSSKILGINPERPGALDFIMGSVNDVSSIVVRSQVAPSVYVVPPGTVKTWELHDLNAPVNTIFNRFGMMLSQVAVRTGSMVMVIDLPAHVDRVITMPSLWYSKIINVVVDAAMYSESVLEEVDNNYIQPLLGMRQSIVNVVLNKALPGLDGFEVKARAYTHSGELFVLPTSPALQYLTSTLKPFVIYKVSGAKTLELFTKQFNAFINALKTQVLKVLGG